MATNRKFARHPTQTAAFKHKGSISKDVAKAPGPAQLRRSSRLSKNTTTILEYTSERETQQAQATVHKKRSFDTEVANPRPKRQKTTQPPGDDELSFKARSIDHWCKFACYPEEMLEMDDHNPYVEMLRSVKRAESRKRANSVSTSFNDDQVTQTSQQSNNKSEYLKLTYSARLAEKGYYMDSEEEPSQEALDAASALLEHKVDLPQQSRFDDDIFKATCRELRHQNETRVVRDFGELMFPSAHHLFLRGRLSANNLAEMVNEQWVQAIKITNKQPMPDVTVGFRRSAFTFEQLAELRDYLAEDGMVSSFAATYTLLFPFITCEVKRPSASLDPADNANAHSIFIAVRGIVQLYQLSGSNLQDLHQTILGFSVSHNDLEVRIHAYYPLIKGRLITYHRCEIKQFLLQHGPDARWTSHRFVAGVYQVWAQTHLTRIKSIINKMIEKRKNSEREANPGTDTQSDGMCTEELDASSTTSMTPSSVQPSDGPIVIADKSSTTPLLKGAKRNPRRG